MVRGDRVWSAVSLSPREKASVIAQSLCGACEIVSTDDGRMPLNVTFPVNVDPWSGQSTKERGSLKKAVNEELVRGGHIQPWNGVVCVTIVSLVPRSNVGRKDSDNLVKGLLDAMEGIVYANDRAIQCLTSRRVEFAGSVGLYVVSARAVYPWDADTVFDDGEPPTVLSGSRIVLP
jgi:hypothetical protein